jgi:hypothetical protein
MHVNLLKLCVGVDCVEDLEAWQAQRRARGETLRHVTRMWPKRADEVVAGGSLYWVIKGVVQARQKILALEEVDRGDGVRRCGLVLDGKVVRVAAVPRRPFQGWRYLDPAEAPPDLSRGRADSADLPPELAAALADIGVR